MAKTIYTERPPQVTAEQFQEQQAWPANVDDCDLMPGPHLHVAQPAESLVPELLFPLVDTDWIVDDGARVLS